MKPLDIHEIREILPHRYPFLLIDRILDHDADKSLLALKNVTINEPFFQGHFPYRPVMPGVLILEALAQASAILASIGLGHRPSANTVYLFAGADKVRFKRQVEPGDQIQIEATMLRKLKGIWKCGAVARVGDEVCCSAELMFTYKEL